MNPLLYYTEYENPDTQYPPVFILHGFLASSRNWRVVSKKLQNDFHVYALDMRNHGRSFHHPKHSITEMVKDIMHFMQELQIKKASFIGHSMGGMVAMQMSKMMSMDNQNYIHKNIIVDIVPKKTYRGRFDNEYKALEQDFSKCKNRKDVDEILKEHIKDVNIRNFLQTSIHKQKDGGYKPVINIEAFINGKIDYTIMAYDEDIPSNVKTLFIKGGESKFILKEDYQIIKKMFPNSKVEVIKESGHFPNYTHPNSITKLIRDFIILE